MRKHRWLLLGLAFAVILLGAGVALHLLPPQPCCQPVPIPPPTPTCCQPLPIPPPHPEQMPQSPSGQGEAAPAQKAASAPAAAKPFAFSRLDLDTSKDTAEACLAFSETLVEGPAAHYEDYVSVPGHPEVGLVASGARICITGLAFGKAYRAEIRAGLPAASGAKLAAGESVPLSFADKAPIVRFASSAQFILPRGGNAGVPITTLNLDEISLRVYRVSDRALFQKLDLQAETMRLDDRIAQLESEQVLCSAHH